MRLQAVPLLYVIVSRLTNLSQMAEFSKPNGVERKHSPLGMPPPLGGGGGRLRAYSGSLSARDASLLPLPQTAKLDLGSLPEYVTLERTRSSMSVRIQE